MDINGKNIVPYKFFFCIGENEEIVTVFIKKIVSCLLKKFKNLETLFFETDGAIGYTNTFSNNKIIEGVNIIPIRCLIHITKNLKNYLHTQSLVYPIKKNKIILEQNLIIINNNNNIYKIIKKINFNNFINFIKIQFNNNNDEILFLKFKNNFCDERTIKIEKNKIFLYGKIDKRGKDFAFYENGNLFIFADGFEKLYN